MAAIEQMSRLHHKLGSSPLISFLLGGFTLVLWSCASVVQIQTSEYLVQNGGTRQVAGVAWAILFQPWFMISGTAPIALVTSWIYAWTVELVTLIFALSLAVAIAKISSVNPTLAKGFVLGSIVLMGLNGWADYAASPGSNPLIQFLVALAIAIIVTLGLPLGAGLIEHGFEEL